MLRSMACRYEQFETEWYRDWCRIIGLHPSLDANGPQSYRKIWEWAAIHAAVQEHGLLEPGRTALGFAVGTEWLPSVFANRGVQVLATDLHVEQDNDRWASTGQHASSREALFHANCVDREDFSRLVTFQPADMKDLDSLPDESADFVWSSCAMEHLGTLGAGTDFVKKAMRLVKPGGLAVHTTEYNCSSNDQTVEAGWNVIYRQQDIERLAHELRMMRCALVTPDFDTGHHQHDMNYDEPPYFQSNSPHIKLLLEGYIATSFLMIIRKAA